MSDIIVNPYTVSSQLVGVIPKQIPVHYSLECSSYEVYMPPGVLKHLKKQGHWNDFMTHHQDLPNMISNPDYAGQNPKEPKSVELYKQMGDNILIAIKLNSAAEPFLGTFFVLKNGESKIEGRLKSGRIYPFSFFK